MLVNFTIWPRPWAPNANAFFVIRANAYIGIMIVYKLARHGYHSTDYHTICFLLCLQFSSHTLWLADVVLVGKKLDNVNITI